MEFLGFIFAIAGFVLVLRARTAIATLNAELPRLTARIAALEDMLARGMRGAAPPAPAAEPEPEAPWQPAASPQAVTPPADKPATADEIFAETPPPPAEPDLQHLPPPPPATSLEERLGTRWAVWVGGFALALGGLLLVRYSIEQGVFGPGFRIFMGTLFSALLVAAGEWFRRGERKLPIDTIPAAHIPSILTAAGTSSAFGTVYAAHALYEFIGPAAAFVLLGAIGVATMLAAALHGPALAGLGLAGALVVPMLVVSQSPNPWPLVIYLAVVAGAAYALARLRRWLWLAGAVVAGCFIWGLGLASSAAGGDAALPWTSALFVHTAVQLALAGVFMAIEPHLGVPDEEARTDWIASAALLALGVLAMLALGQARFDAQWGTFAIVAVGILAATAWRSAPASTAAAFAGAVALAAIATWPSLKDPPDASLLAPFAAQVLRLPENVSGFLVFAAALTFALFAVSTLRIWRGRMLPELTASFHALAATVPLLLALALAYLRVTQFDRSIPFALFAILLVAIFYLAARQFDTIPPEQRTPATRLITGAFAAAAAAAASLALVMLLDRGYLTLAFAITAFTTSAIALALHQPMLRYVVVALGFIVLARLAWDPRIMGADVGTWPIFNWLLVGYGAPAVAFLGAANVLRREKDDLAARICDALGVLFAALLMVFQIRHALNGGDPLAPMSGHIEQGLLAFTSIAFAYVLMRLDLGRANAIFRAASYIFGIVSAVLIVMGLGLLNNPLLTNQTITGANVFSSLMLAYLLPGAAAVLLARAARNVRPAWYVTGAALLAIWLLFGYVTLEVRHVFQGPNIAFWKSTQAAEVWAYSIAWLALGLAFLAYGIVRVSREARLASAALVILSVLKVFLYDLSGITGLWRALSFICLGAVLIGIGLVYQRLIFAKPKPRLAQPPA